jgi:DMSO/TMAO reductase YedYZ molybdopterin-dependent catalytic subunit
MSTVVGRVASERDHALQSPVHDQRTAAILGICLGIAFTTSFLTGLYSHLLQHPPDWLAIPSRPAGLYRVTQGLHVATGIATIPLLLAKLWSVYPRFFQWPPVRSLPHAIERLMLVPLVCGSVFMLFTGFANIARWYPWNFFFTRGHYWVAWITVGAMVTHLGAKATVTRHALARRPKVEANGLSRRGFLLATGSFAGLLTVTTVGQTINPLRRLVLFAPRKPDIGSQRLPVNRAAAEAGVNEAAADPNYRLALTGAVANPLSLSVTDVEARADHEAELPIACVEGWSASAVWRGVPVHALLDEAGVDRTRPVEVDVRSLERDGLYAQSVLNHFQVNDRDTMLAVAVNGERLDLDHGYPCRLIAPNRPGVMQTKWVTELVVR